MFGFLRRSFCSSKMEYLYGVNPIEVALHSGKREIQELIVSDSEAIDLGSRLCKIIMKAKEKNIPVKFCAKQRLSRLVKNQPHQNVLLKCSSISVGTPIQPSQYPKGVYVYCDKITDPQNFGAILRSCLFFGVRTIFTPKKHTCPLNSTVSKTSSGSLQLVNIHHISKEEKFLQGWKSASGLILSTSVSQHTSQPVDFSSIPQSEYQKTLILMGSEGVGVSPHLAKHSHYSIQIPRQGPSEYPFCLVDSLNVNSALTCILYELTKKPVQ